MPGFRLSSSATENDDPGTWSTSAWPRRLLTLILGLSLITAFTLAVPSTTQARPLGYSCGNANTRPHCYAQTNSQWPTFSEFAYAQGATVKILVVSMQCSQCGGGTTTSGFVDNEMWLIDGSGYFVEAGYSTHSNPLQTYEEYFWGDYRPADCSGCINQHPWGDVPSGDYNQYATFTIKRSSSTSFHVTASSPHASKTGDSTNNTMTVIGVNMGQELAGNAGASAPYAHYIYRYYWNSSGVSTAIGTHYAVDHPASGPPYWNQISGTTVGDFETHCC